MKKTMMMVAYGLGVFAVLGTAANLVMFYRLRHSSSAALPPPAEVPMAPDDRPAADPEQKQLDALIDQLGNDDPAKRMQAELELLQKGQAAIPALALAAEIHPRNDIRQRCVELIERIRANPENLKELIANLFDPDPARQSEAEKALVHIGKPALPVLTEALQKFSNPESRQRIQKVIQQINAVAQSPQPQSGPRLSEGPTDAQLEAVRRYLQRRYRGVQLAQENNRVVHPSQLTREQLVGVYYQLNKGKSILEGVEAPKLTDLTLDLTSTLGFRLSEAKDGLRVTAVKIGSAADHARIRSGDIIHKINRRTVTTLEEAKAALSASQGSAPELEISRGEQLQTVKLNIPSSKFDERL
jgi:hypothetical protein